MKKFLLLLFATSILFDTAKCPIDAHNTGSAAEITGEDLEASLSIRTDFEQYSDELVNNFFKRIGNGIAAGARWSWQKTASLCSQALTSTSRVSRQAASDTGTAVVAAGRIAASSARRGWTATAPARGATAATITNLLHQAWKDSEQLRKSVEQRYSALPKSTRTGIEVVGGAGALAALGAVGIPGAGYLIPIAVGYPLRELVAAELRQAGPAIAGIATANMRGIGQTIADEMIGLVTETEATQALQNIPTDQYLQSLMNHFGRTGSSRATELDFGIALAKAQDDAQDAIKRLDLHKVADLRLCLDKLTQQDLRSLQTLCNFDTLTPEQKSRLLHTRALVALVQLNKLLEDRNTIQTLINPTELQRVLPETPPAIQPGRIARALGAQPTPASDFFEIFRPVRLIALPDENRVTTFSTTQPKATQRDAALNLIAPTNIGAVGSGAAAMADARQYATLHTRAELLNAGVEIKHSILPKAYAEIKGQWKEIRKVVLNKETFLIGGAALTTAFLFPFMLQLPAFIFAMAKKYLENKIDEIFNKPGFISKTDYRFIYKIMPFLRFILQPPVPKMSEFMAPEDFKNEISDFIQELKALKSSKSQAGMCALFYGSYGVGKTYVSDIVAREAGYRVAHISASMIRENKTFAEMMKKRFEWARKNNVIFVIDEVEVLLDKSPEQSQDRMVLNEIIGLMGTPERRPHMILITNYPEKLNNAFVGAGGRVNRFFCFPSPDLPAVKKMIENMVNHQTKALKIKKTKTWSLDFDKVTEVVGVRPGREIYDLVAAACLKAKVDKSELTVEHFEFAIKRIAEARKNRESFNLADAIKHKSLPAAGAAA